MLNVVLPQTLVLPVLPAWNHTSGVKGTGQISSCPLTQSSGCPSKTLPLMLLVGQTVFATDLMKSGKKSESLAT